MGRTKERAASIKETGEELPPDQWEEFEAAAQEAKKDAQTGDVAKKKDMRRPTRAAGPIKKP